MPGAAAFFVLLAGIAGAARADDQPVPWPDGAPPDDARFAEIVAEAVEIGRRDFADEAVAAIEPNEDREHVTVPQGDVDQGAYSLDVLFNRGDEFFAHAFSTSDGYGAGPDHRLHRIHTGVRGGLDTQSCEGCHTVGGLDGAGSETQRAFLEGDGDRESSALIRNAPQVIGLGFIQALALEMTGDLGRQRDAALNDATTKNLPVTIQLSSKGIAFGTLTVSPSGIVDTSKVEGIDADLVVKPFGWKGTVSRLRRFAEDAARVHFGIQSHVLAENAEKKPDPDKLGNGPNWYDPDNDGYPRELEEGTLTASGVYMTMLESPVILLPFDSGLKERWLRGGERFDEIGCASCHTRDLPLYIRSWKEMPDTTTGAGVSVFMFGDGDQPKSGPNVKLFSDLKRHDMGPDLADPHDNGNGVSRSEWLTRPLWGLAESAPYMHDGRAATIPEAILAHGGEAQHARDAFAALPSDAQADLHVFLLSLSRAQKPRMAR